MPGKDDRRGQALFASRGKQRNRVNGHGNSTHGQGGSQREGCVVQVAGVIEKYWQSHVSCNSKSRTKPRTRAGCSIASCSQCHSTRSFSTEEMHHLQRCRPHNVSVFQEDLSRMLLRWPASGVMLYIPDVVRCSRRRQCSAYGWSVGTGELYVSG